MIVEDRIVEFSQLSETQKEEFVDIFIAGFGHLFNFQKELKKFKVLFVASFHEEYSHAYIKNQQVVGILLLATNKLRPIKLNEMIAIDLFGIAKGIAMTKQMNSIFQSKVVKNDKDLYIDVIAVSKKLERQGIGSKLLQFAFSIQGFHNYYLEVLSKNENAKRLYDSFGFYNEKKHYFSLVRLLGYGYPIRMKKKEN